MNWLYEWDAIAEGEWALTRTDTDNFVDPDYPSAFIRQLPHAYKAEVALLEGEHEGYTGTCDLVLTRAFTDIEHAREWAERACVMLDTYRGTFNTQLDTISEKGIK